MDRRCPQCDSLLFPDGSCPACSKKNQGCGCCSCLGWFATLGIACFGVLLFTVTPFEKSAQQAREKSCYANMRVILGAVEIYNLDNAVPLLSVSQQDVQAGGVLVRQGYLKNPINLPTPQCRYSGQNLLKDGRIVCASHGTVDGPDSGFPATGPFFPSPPFQAEPPPPTVPAELAPGPAEQAPSPDAGTAQPLPGD